MQYCVSRTSYSHVSLLPPPPFHNGYLHFYSCAITHNVCFTRSYVLTAMEPSMLYLRTLRHYGVARDYQRFGEKYCPYRQVVKTSFRRLSNWNTQLRGIRSLNYNDNLASLFMLFFANKKVNVLGRFSLIKPRGWVVDTPASYEIVPGIKSRKEYRQTYF